MNTSKTIHRRQFLRAAGAFVALPMLESFQSRAVASAAGTAPKARRLVCVGAELGMHTPALYPKKAGADYEMTRTLQPLEAMRGDFTLFSGLDHRAGGAHGGWRNYLLGPKLVGSVSLDQQVAAKIGDATRFSSFVLSAGGGPQMCFTEGGVALPAIDRPSLFYKKMFASDSDRKRTEHLLKSGRSALDYVLEDARSLQRSVSGADKDKLEEYFTSLREVEHRIGKQLSHANDPVPKVDYKLPDADPLASNLLIECESVMYDLIALALQTDSSRVLSMSLRGGGEVFTIGGEMLRFGYHALSHHGNDPEKIAELTKIDTEHMKSFAKFLAQLKSKTDAEGRPLLDSTIVMWGTGMGDASRHSNQDLPVVLAGGGFKHGRHLNFQRTDSAEKDLLLGDLFITLQRQLGIECQGFAQAKRGLDAVLHV